MLRHDPEDWEIAVIALEHAEQQREELFKAQARLIAAELAQILRRVIR